MHYNSMFFTSSIWVSLREWQKRGAKKVWSSYYTERANTYFYDCTLPHKGEIIDMLFLLPGIKKEHMSIIASVVLEKKKVATIFYLL